MMKSAFLSALGGVTPRTPVQAEAAATWQQETHFSARLSGAVKDAVKDFPIRDEQTLTALEQVGTYANNLNTQEKPAKEDSDALIGFCLNIQNPDDKVAVISLLGDVYAGSFATPNNFNPEHPTSAEIDGVVEQFKKDFNGRGRIAGAVHDFVKKDQFAQDVKAIKAAVDPEQKLTLIRGVALGHIAQILTAHNADDVSSKTLAFTGLVRTLMPNMRIERAQPGGELQFVDQQGEVKSSSLELGARRGLDAGVIVNLAALGLEVAAKRGGKQSAAGVVTVNRTTSNRDVLVVKGGRSTLREGAPDAIAEGSEGSDDERSSPTA